METKKLYLTDMHGLSCEAVIIDMPSENEIVLDQTVFYVQGGGQPYDQGIVTSETGTFAVEEVKGFDGTIIHKGKIQTGSLQKGQKVHCEVNAERRSLMARLHSAGHVIDRAILEMGYVWPPDRGYHYPDGAYVMYQANTENAEALKEKLIPACAAIIEKAEETKIDFIKAEEAKKKFTLPPFIEPNDDVRLVYFGESFALPCGGTHVKNLKDIGKVTIRKIKNDGEKIKISYGVEAN